MSRTKQSRHNGSFVGLDTDGGVAPSPSTPAPVADGSYFNLLEPSSLVDAFIKDPPVGFRALEIQSSDRVTPAFTTSYDLLTTLDPPVKRVLNPILKFSGLGLVLKPRTLFVGTTVSEYLLYPSWGDSGAWIMDCLKRAEAENVSLLILKDMPSNSPLLGPDENARADEIRDHCRRAGFQFLAGQALAYVPIDFGSIEEYLQKLSSSRRKDLRRKLRKRVEVQVEEIPLGDPVFSDEDFVGRLFELYLNVYRQSEIHFDRLSFPFFSSVVRRCAGEGMTFVYRHRGKIIGFNLCFIHRNNLIDKTIGLVYPDARDLNLYFVSWLFNLEYAIRHGLKYYIAGWTDPEVKRSLGAEFTFTQHAVYPRNPVFRAGLVRFRRFFEMDQNWADTRRNRFREGSPEETP
ncbi:MAG TPA: GNAT family N-acetyltransferase [Nitrospiria bacterium]|nr:GNAT family N-acetyltransferase [Nitrospiria bacterium]